MTASGDAALGRVVGFGARTLLVFLVATAVVRSADAPPPLPSRPDAGATALWTPSGVGSARERWVPMSGSLPVSVVASGDRTALRMQCNFRGTRHERASWDLPVELDLAGVRGVSFRVFSPDATPISQLSLYFRSGSGWYATSFSAGGARGWKQVEIQREDARVEGTPSGWGRIDALRVSAWRGSDADAELFLADLSLLDADASIVVLRCDSAERAGHAEQSSVERYCDNMTAWVRELGLPVVALGDLELKAHHLDGKRLVILPYNPTFPQQAGVELRRFLGSGGKLLIFYALPAALRDAVGIRGGRHIPQKAPGQFASIRAPGGILGRGPAVVPQASWNIVDALPVAGRSRVVAWWFDESGTSTDHAALVVSDNCALLTHVLLPGDPARRQAMLLAMVAHFAPALLERAFEYALESAHRLGRFESRLALVEAVRELAGDREDVSRRLRRHLQTVEQARAAAGRADGSLAALALARQARTELIDAWCVAQPALAGEHRAFWCHSAFGVAGRSWDDAIATLSRAGFTAILPNMLWGGTAFYRSEILPVAPAVETRGDQIALCVEACRRHQVECHVWKVNWNLSGHASREFVQRMTREGRTQVHRDGTPRERWLCPSHPANRRLEIDSMLEVARRYEVDGLHFDYIRFPGADGCFCPGCRERFGQQVGEAIDAWPGAVLRDGALREAWLEFRREQITPVVREVAERARQIRPGIRISAAVFRNWPSDRDTIGQDWKLWCDRGWLDFVCPMDYTADAEQFESLVRRQLTWTGKVPCYPGIGLSTWRDRADVLGVIDQIAATRRLGTGGFTVFNYGTVEADEVVPKLGAGITRRP